MHEELMQEFETEFKKVKKRLGFNVTLEELDNMCYLCDHVKRIGFVSTVLSKFICRDIVDTLKSWGDYLHSVIHPNPHSMFNLTESNAFTDKEKKDLFPLLDRIMELSSRNALIGLSEDSKKQAQFIDEAYNFWQDSLKSKLIEILIKVNHNWEKESHSYDGD